MVAVVVVIMVETVSDGGGSVEDGGCDGGAGSGAGGGGGSGVGMMEVAAMGRISGGSRGSTCNCGGDGGRSDGDGGDEAGGDGSSDGDDEHRWQWWSG